MPTRRPLESFRPDGCPVTGYGFGRDYSLPLLTRRAFGRCEGSVVSARDTLPCRMSPAGLGGSRRPPG